MCSIVITIYRGKQRSPLHHISKPASETCDFFWQKYILIVIELPVRVNITSSTSAPHVCK